MRTQPKETTQEATGLYGPRGWTSRRDINRLLQPYLTHPHNFDQLDGMEYLINSFDIPNLADYDPFAGLGGKTAARLRQLLPNANLTDRQNNAPQCEELLSLAAQNPQIELFGYAIGPNRWDERISVEGLIYYTDQPALQQPLTPESAEATWQNLAVTIGLNSYLAAPDEIYYFRPHWNYAKAGWRLWWD